MAILSDTGITRTPPRLILASGSPRRRELIASLGLTFEVIKSDIPEVRGVDEHPYAYVQRLSHQKAEAVLARLTDGGTVLAADTIVLAADTIGVTGSMAGTDDLLEKPADAAEARAMLARLRGRWHVVCTAFALLPSQGHGVYGVEATRVLMRDYTDDEIEAYIATGDPFDKAGGYAIQHVGFAPVARIEGCYNNVVGLPLCAVRRALVALGWPGLHAPEGCDCPVSFPQRSG